MDSNKVLFISDVHLGLKDKASPKNTEASPKNTGASEKERERKPVNFLRSNLETGDRLIIVGDLFDFWFEYRTVIPKDFILILSCLKELAESDVRIDYIAGNHDFWVGDFFQKDLGLHFHSTHLKETIGEKSFYIIHGDGLKKSDSGYRLLKRVFRNRLNIFLYRWLHPDLGVPLAKWFSGSSRKHTQKRDYGGQEEYIEFADKLFADGVDHVVMAHTHKPLEHKTDTGKSLINLGDWIDHFTYAELSGNTISLKTYKE